MNRKLVSWATVGVLAVLLVAVNILSFNVFRGTRADLTEQNLYTLSEGSKNILEKIEEPITLRFYYSRKLASKTVPGLSPYVTLVQEFLEEYRDQSNGKIKLEVIDPEPFSEEEEEAAMAGLQTFPVGTSGEPLFFGLVGENTVDETEVIEFFNPERQRFLENDITTLIYELSSPKKSVVGLIGTLPLMGDRGDRMAMMRNPEERQEPYAVVQQIESTSAIRDLGEEAANIDEDVDVLMVVHPKQLSDETLYAIDQFILRGGHALVFVDPHAEADRPPVDPQNPYAGMWADRSSNLEPLFEKWGITLKKDVFAADRELAQQVTVRDQRGVAQRVRYVAYLALEENQRNSDDIVTSPLQLPINVGSPGIIEVLEDAETNVEPLLWTTEESAEMDVEKIKLMPQPDELLAEFEPSGKEQTIAVRITGKAKTAFPGGVIESPDDDNGESEQPESKPDHLEESKGDINVIVVADTDLLMDQFWVSVQPFFGSRLMQTFAGNGGFVANAIENLSGSNDLIGIRARGEMTRPFEVVEEIRKDAEERFLKRSQELEQKLQELEQKINDIQANRTDSSSGTLILNDEQRQAIEEARAERRATYEELREVNHKLSKDIERLGLWVNAINIGAIPLLIGLYAALLGMLRMTRRKS